MQTYNSLFVLTGITGGELSEHLFMVVCDLTFIVSVNKANVPVKGIGHGLMAGCKLNVLRAYIVS